MPRLTSAFRFGLRAIGCVAAGVLLASCGPIPGSPHAAADESRKILFAPSAQKTPKYLDPTASYSEDATPFVFLTYEPPYRFDYLKRPYELAPRSALSVVVPNYLDAQGRPLPADAPPEKIAESVYDIPIRGGILFAPHPAFARGPDGQLLYHHLSEADLTGIRRPLDFPKVGTRELVADDFVYAIRRLATTRIESPGYSTLAEMIVGLKDYGRTIADADRELRANLAPDAADLPFLDFRRYPMPGAQALNPHLLRIRIKGKSPQFKYWLQMPFLAPIPWEADAFYNQKGMAAHNLTLNNWPVGTGPFMVTEYIENRLIRMDRNPNFRGEPYPCEGEPSDRQAGLLDDCGKPMPFVDRIEANFEKESVPLNAKFTAGYYDIDEIWSMEVAGKYAVDAKNSDETAERFRQRGIVIGQTPQVGIWYLGFNWLDPVVGEGKTAEQQLRNRKLRQAISIAVDWEEFMRVFETKASGIAAHSPVPPGVFGYRPDAFNPNVYDIVDGRPVRKSIEAARQLMREAGYPNGIDERSGRPLVINYDFLNVLSPELKSQVDWTAKQFAKLGIQLEIRATDFNRFQDKMNHGMSQIFFWGWMADYPDAENFLFLLYGPNTKAGTGGNGENAANYRNPEFDRLYERFKYLDDGAEKQQLIDRMVAIVQDDAPWSFGYYPYAYKAYNAWVYNLKPNVMSRDKLEYVRLEPEQRAASLTAWNRPIRWPLWMMGTAFAAAVAPAVFAWRRRERMTAGRSPAPGA